MTETVDAGRGSSTDTVDIKVSIDMTAAVTDAVTVEVFSAVPLPVVMACAVPSEPVEVGSELPSTATTE